MAPALTILAALLVGALGYHIGKWNAVEQYLEDERAKRAQWTTEGA